MSSDYGATWTLFAQYATTGSSANADGCRIYANGLSVGRPLFIVGGYEQTGYTSATFTNDVWVAYW
jgi:hypothetical protein